MLTGFNSDDAPDISPSPSGFSSENLRKCAEVIQFMETLQEFEVDLEDELLKAIHKISAMPSFQKARAIYDQNAYLAAQELNISWRQKLSDVENAYIDAKTNLIKQKKATLKIIEDNAVLEEENKTMREHLKKLGYEMTYIEESKEDSPD
jgi:hypothetical protein